MAHIPLTPLDGAGRSVGDSALMPADIIVSTTNEAVSGAIRAGTGSQISHAMLYIGNGEVVEAIDKGVVKRNIHTAISGSRLAVAYRHKALERTPGYGRLVANKAITYSDQKIQYDYTGAVGAGLSANPKLCLVTLNHLVCGMARSGAMNHPDKFYCSELVLEAFKSVGIPIVFTNIKTSTPEDFVQSYHSGQLNYIGHLKTSG